jgi:hypothetical protein
MMMVMKELYLSVFSLQNCPQLEPLPPCQLVDNVIRIHRRIAEKISSPISPVAKVLEYHVHLRWK